MSAPRPWKVHTQQRMDDSWMFWILAPNNATVAKSCHHYKTQNSAVKGAVKLLSAWRTNGIRVETR
jgi:hypothetical protein